MTELWHVSETGWLERMRSTEAFAYRMPVDTFEPWDPLWSKVVESTLAFSGIRLRNAVRP